MQGHLRSVSAAGFTAVELAVTGAAIGIATAFAFPLWTGFSQGARVNTAGTRAAAALHQARDKARHSSRSWQASFRHVDGVTQWSVHPHSTSLENRRTTEVAWNTLSEHVTILEAGTTFERDNGTWYVAFDRRGLATSEATGQLVLFSEAGDRGVCLSLPTLIGDVEAENFVSSSTVPTCNRVPRENLGKVERQ